MTTYTIASGYDAYTNSAASSINFGSATSVHIFHSVSGTAISNAYVYLPIPDDVIGKTISSATLAGNANGSYSAFNVTAKLVTGAWAESIITAQLAPSVGSSPSTSTALGAGGVGYVNLDVTSLIQAVASGQVWYGIQLSTATSGGGANFYSFESDSPSWTLTIEATEAPETPQSLVPNGTIVGSSQPVLTCDFTDNGGLTNDMAAMNVQVDTTTAFTSPGYDHTITTTVPVFDLSANAFTALTSGAVRYWRVRVQDADGNWSDWSDPAQFTYVTQPTITLLTPAAGVLWDPTSDVIASTSANLSAYRVQITEATDQTLIRYDSGRLPANPSALTTVQVSLPQKYDGQRVLVDDRDYQLHIRVWDTQTDRQSTPGSAAWVDSWSTFHFDDDLTQTPISTLAADQLDASPAVTLTWTRASAPDAWLVLRDDQVIERLDPADVITGVSTYSWTDTHPRPWVEHTYDVRALTDVSGTSKRSPAGPTAAIVPECRGLWLFTGDGQQVALDDTDVSQLTVNDRRTTYKPIRLPYDVDIVTGFEGLSGPTSGTIPTALDDSVTMEDARAVLLSIKENPGSSVHLVYGSFSGEVLLRNIAIVPDARGNVAVPLLRVSFGVNQVDNFGQVI